MTTNFDIQKLGQKSQQYQGVIQRGHQLEPGQRHGRRLRLSRSIAYLAWGQAGP